VVSIFESSIQKFQIRVPLLTVDWQRWGLNVIRDQIRSCWFSMETWNTGCTVQRLSGSRSVMEWVLGCARISYGPRNFSASFLEGHSYGRIDLDVCLATDFEFWSRKSSGISGSLVSMLSFSRCAVEVVGAAHRGQ